MALKSYLIVLLICFSTGHASASSYFKEETKELPVAKGEKHSFCLKPVGGGKIEGVNTKTSVRIASVSKLFTSYWALFELGPDYRFMTRIHYSPKQKRIHIEGANDPLFGRDRMYLLLSELNKQGIYELDRLSFDSNFQFEPNTVSNILSSLGIRGGVSQEMTKESLELFLNTERWETVQRYERSKRTAGERGLDLLPEVSLRTEYIESFDRWPFLPTDEVLSWEFRSVSLLEYLKYMNVESHNYIADELFNYLGGEKGFQRFIYDDMGLTSRDITMHTGSGLPLEMGDSRKDNRSSCETVIGLLEKLSELLEDGYGLGLQDLMLVTGEDKGTLKKLIGDIFYRSVLGKTGTVNQAINLAGQVQTERGEHYYGIYLQVPSESFWGQARSVRDQVLLRLIESLGGPRQYDYEKSESFFALEPGSEFRAYKPPQAWVH